jgi:hypothetical protein
LVVDQLADWGFSDPTADEDNVGGGGRAGYDGGRRGPGGVRAGGSRRNHGIRESGHAERVLDVTWIEE